ncbi:MAG TPA: thioredoxin-disulfide reductase, partial [Syntrophaceae bacterium]|nr:thioredoxin-disulfide reductase [Syntrophaceae bacterium]
EVIIVGGGPAGLTAGLYTARARLNTLLIERLAPGGQVLLSDWIENYPAYPDGISGIDLIQKMVTQVQKFGLHISTGVVESINLPGKVKEVRVNGHVLSCRCVIIATGAQPKRLGVERESDLMGRGVSFCATCDAPFFKNQEIAVVGGGDTAIQEALFLTKFASKVFVIHRRNRLRATGILQERAFSNKKIEFVWDTVVEKILGSDKVEGLTLRNVKTNSHFVLPLQGVFIFIGIRPNTDFIKDSPIVNQEGFVVTNENMETSIPGIFAAGDVRDKLLRQISTAVGDGAVAAFAAEKYLEHQK